MNSHCPDCGVPEGFLHKRGCDMERCPFCGNQLNTCSCIYEKLGISPLGKVEGTTLVRWPELTEVQTKEWDRILEEKGRIPWINYPLMCKRCGKQGEGLIRERGEEWEWYIEPNYRSNFICKECYQEIKSLIDSGDRGKRNV